MSTRERKIISPLKKFARFIGIFIRNRRGLVGLAIILGFGVLALGAPLWTPYDPTAERFVSGQYAAPSWLDYLPPALGGMPGAAQNMEVADNANFTNGLETWKYSADSHVSIDYSSDASYDDGGGSAKILFTRNETGTTYGKVTATLYKEFDFPYQGAPRKFLANIDMLAGGTSYMINETLRNETWRYGIDPDEFHYIIGPAKIMEVNMTVSVFMSREYDNASFYLWPYRSMTLYGLKHPGIVGNTKPSPGTIYKIADKWITSSAFPIDSGYISFPVANVSGNSAFNLFTPDSTPGKFILGINVTFNDLYYPNKPVEASLNIDDFDITFLGTIWGIMGTDYIGRDLWSQLVYGARISLYVGLLASIIGVVIGLIVGLAAGYMGRYVDELLMRFSDLLLVIPTLPLLIVLVAVLGPALENLIILIGFLGWMGFARLVRSQVLSLRERPFVEAAKAVGAGKTHIMSKHIFPNVISLVYVSLATSVPGAIVSEAALSFLGFYDPNKISWGRMLYDVQANGAAQYWWWVIPPGLCIALLAIAFVLLGFALDEVFNPRLRMRR